jgi:hypothetical protein
MREYGTRQFFDRADGFPTAAGAMHPMDEL